MSSIPRVSSNQSELNDFTETSEGEKIYHVSKSRLIGLINVIHVLRIYLPIVWFILLGILVVQITMALHNSGFDLGTFYSQEVAVFELQRADALGVGWKVVAAIVIVIWYLTRMENPVYLLDFATFEPPETWKKTPEEIMEIMKGLGCFNEESVAFMARMLKQSGCGPRTAWPPGIIRCLEGLPADSSAEAARKESEVVMFDVVRKALAKTNTKARDIDILVVNCSLFSPTPSLTSMIINEFGLKADTSSYNLSGMGCSAGVISIELVKHLLAARPNSIALVVSTENLTQNLYLGNERSFLLQNTLFRVGGAAMVLSNKWTDAFRARFKLLHVVRTQYVSEDSFGCVLECEDEKSNRGVRLSKEIVKVAGRAMEKNFTTLGPHILPISEQAKTGFWMLIRYLAKQAKASLGVDFGKVSPYIPDFKRGIDHFCIHAGGRGVIDGIEKNLSLAPKQVEASRYALYTYGNTSSSSIWYEMEYIVNHSALKRGQRVLQVAFGSGFKCNSCVWICMNNKTNKPAERDIDKKTN